MNKLKSWFLICLLGFLICQPAYSKAQESPILKSAIAKLKQDPALKHASWSVCIQNIESGEKVVEFEPERSLVPASNVKLFTTAAALSLLGHQYRFETRLQYAGIIDSLGVLQGNVIIKGGGDPTLGTIEMNGTKTMDELMAEWAQNLADLGILVVNGDIIGDAGIFNDNLPPSDWTFEDMGNYYGAFATGLSIHDNKFNIHFKTGTKEGDSTEIVAVSESIPGLELITYVTTGKKGSGDKAYVHGSPFAIKYFLKGTLPPGYTSFKIQASIPDPALFCAAQLKKILEENGLQVKGVAKGYSLGENLDTLNPYLISKHYSPDLATIINHINIESDNLFAEHLLKAIGYAAKKDGSTIGGLNTLNTFLSISGANSPALNLADGSGLARRNKISAELMVRFLAHQFTTPEFDYYLASLPIAGQNGTIKNLAKGSIAEGKIYAKSGTLDGVRNYSGYIKSTTGTWYAFSLLANNFDCSATAMAKKWEPILIAVAGM